MAAVEFSAGVPYRHKHSFSALIRSATHLHLHLELLLQDSAELLHIVLHERIERFPAERLCEFGRAFSGSVLGSRRRGRGTHRQVGLTSGDGRKHAEGREAAIRMGCRHPSVFDTRPTRSGLTPMRMRDSPCGRHACSTETAAASSCNKSHPGSSIRRIQSPSSSRS